MVSEFHAPHGIEQHQRTHNAFDLHMMDAQLIKNYAIHTENSLPAKDNKVTQEFDTTPAKNTALTTVKQRVEEVERALFNKAQAIRKVEAEHTKIIDEASIALDRVLMEALQNGVDLEEYDVYLPEYADDLGKRVAGLLELTQLANVEASV